MNLRGAHRDRPSAREELNRELDRAENAYLRTLRETFLRMQSNFGDDLLLLTAHPLEDQVSIRGIRGSEDIPATIRAQVQ